MGTPSEPSWEQGFAPGQLRGGRALEDTLTGALALALTCCWPGWPSSPQQLAAARPLELCWLAALGSARLVRERERCAESA